MKSFHSMMRIALLLIGVICMVIPLSARAQVDTTSAGGVVRVAPGELLPISVKLSNFGGGTRVDVLLKYGIFTNTGHEVISTSDTVAVETTASFIKTVQVPFDTEPGTYTTKTTVVYEGQLVPATSQFTFTVERKLLGLFQGDLILYGGVTLLVSIALSVMGFLSMRHRRTRSTPFDYSHIPHGKRTFYEILSDTIMQMRGRIGDDALVIASHIEGLKINPETGRIIAMTGSPAKIIATLVSGYEKLLGKKVSFTFRRGGSRRY